MFKITVMFLLASQCVVLFFQIWRAWCRLTWTWNSRPTSGTFSESLTSFVQERYSAWSERCSRSTGRHCGTNTSAVSDARSSGPWKNTDVSKKLFNKVICGHRWREMSISICVFFIYWYFIFTLLHLMPNYSILGQKLWAPKSVDNFVDQPTSHCWSQL